MLALLRGDASSAARRAEGDRPCATRAPAGDERSRLARDLGPHYAMILRNHGLLTCGRSIAEVFVLMYQLERVCRSQLAAMAAGGKLRLPPPEVCERTALQYGCNRGEPAGVVEWPHWVRMTDRLDPSYRS